MSTKARRRQLILDVLQQHQTVPNQDRLAAHLSARGIVVTQATLSRDLRDLNVFKGPSGYVLNQGGADAGVGNAQIESAVKLYMLSATTAGSLVVFRTRPGHASPLASELDRAGITGIAGTIAGDDTIFVAVVSPARAKSLVRLCRQLVARA
ncbi:MAG: arginine repressor [Phycisphaerales bacterium]